MMTSVEPAPSESAFSFAWWPSLRDALLRPRTLFAGVRAGPVAPALRLASFSTALTAAAGVLTDDALREGELGPILGRALALWLLGVLWLIGPQAWLFHGIMRLFGARQPASLAQRAMGLFSTLLGAFGLIMSIAGINPESAPYVITWYGALAAISVLGTHALYRLAEGAYALGPTKAIAAVVSFEVVHGIALLIALGAFFAASTP